MKKTLLIFAVSVFALVLAMGTAGAAVFNDGGASLQGVLDGITTAPVAGSSSVDVTTDDIADAFDSYWHIPGSSGSTTTMVIELGAFAPNALFGIYDMSNPANAVEVFQGVDSSGAQAIISIAPTGDVSLNGSNTGVNFGSANFGYYLDVSHYYGSAMIWHSDTSLNVDATDHMYAYQGKDIDTVQIASLAPGLWTSSEYVLAFEDLPVWSSGFDANYSDMVVMVDSVQNVPIPATLLLFGSGLFGLVGFRRKTRS